MGLRDRRIGYRLTTKSETLDSAKIGNGYKSITKSRTVRVDGAIHIH